MAYFSPTAHWRDSARSARFFVVDARAAFPLFIFLMHIRIWTGMLVLVSVTFFGILERYGFTVPVFLDIAISPLNFGTPVLHLICCRQILFLNSILQ